MITNKTKRPAPIVCQVCKRKCGRDACHYTRGKIITCQDCERAGTGYIRAPEIVFSVNPIHNGTAGSLREQIENCADFVDRKLGGTVNWLRDHFPGAPDRVLRQVALHEKAYGEMCQDCLRKAANLRLRLKRLRNQRRQRLECGRKK